MRKRIYLKSWQELVGELMDIREYDGSLVVELSSGVIECPVNSLRGEILKEELLGNEGRRTAILRTDLPERPFAVNVED